MAVRGLVRDGGRLTLLAGACAVLSNAAECGPIATRDPGDPTPGDYPQIQV